MSATATSATRPIHQANAACSAIIDEAEDLAGFLAAADGDLPNDTAVEAAMMASGRSSPASRRRSGRLGRKRNGQQQHGKPRAACLHELPDPR
jgi:hypothetical protein